MLARVKSCAVHGIEGFLLAVKVDNSYGTNRQTIVGLPDMAIRESQERVSSAIKNSGFRFPQGNNVINLAPADIRKEEAVRWIYPWQLGCWRLLGRLRRIVCTIICWWVSWL